MIFIFFTPSIYLILNPYYVNIAIRRKNKENGGGGITYIDCSDDDGFVRFLREHGPLVTAHHETRYTILLPLSDLLSNKNINLNIRSST